MSALLEGYMKLLIRDEEAVGIVECQVESEYTNDHMNLRISSVFVILVTSSFGACLPLLSSRYSVLKMPEWCFFLAKYFGSGVIIATAFIHLLVPANESLSDECLGGAFAEYPMAFGICLIFLFVMFFLELVAHRQIEYRASAMNVKDDHCMFGDENVFVNKKKGKTTDVITEQTIGGCCEPFGCNSSSNDVALCDDPDDSFSECNSDDNLKDSNKLTNYLGNLLSVFILEFGILFHSVFIGLSLACAGDEFITLYIVLVFHQTFEGLGLGTRIALVDWPKSKRLTPWILAWGYGLTTPVAIAIGLGVRKTYLPGSRASLIVNGVCDSISSGILIYTGLVELMAHEFFFCDEFKGEGGFKKLLSAYFVMISGAGIMALLGKWA